MKRIVSFVFIPAVVVLILLTLSACEETPKSYSYEDLSETKKAIIDGILDDYNVWNTYYDSGKHFYCTNISFFYEDGQLIFATCYKTSSWQNVGDGVNSMTGVLYKIFEVDTSDGSLSGHSYSVYDNPVKKNAAMISAACGAEFSNSLSLSEKRNVLANEYYQMLYQ